MRGVIYARYSEGPRQTDQSIEGQVADCRAYAADHGIDIIEIYADRHVSGKSVDGRDEFQRMIRDAQRHAFDAVIVWKVDRFGRNREDIAVNKIRLKQAGVTLMYAKESIPDGPEGILLESLMEGLAEYYSADLRQKVTRGMNESAKKGIWPCGVLPIGYVRDEHKRIAVDPVKAEAVRRVYHLYLEGAPMDALRDALYSAGVTTRKGGRPGQGTVYKMLRNESYMGRFEYNGIPVPADAIIDEETFERVQEHHRPARMNAAGKATVDFLLSCKCSCGYCGALLNGDSATGRHGGKFYYYTCGSRKHGKKCELKSIRKDDLEEIVIKRTLEDVLTDDLIEVLSDRIMAIQKEERKADPAEGLRQRLAELRKRESNLVRVLETAPTDALAKRLAELADEASALEVEIAHAEIKRPLIPREFICAWLKSFRDGDRDDPAFRRRLVDTFIADVAVENDQLTIFYNMTKDAAGEGSRTASLVDFKKSYSNPEGPVIWRWFIVLQIAV